MDGHMLPLFLTKLKRTKAHMLRQRTGAVRTSFTYLFLYSAWIMFLVSNNCMISAGKYFSLLQYEERKHSAKFHSRRPSTMDLGHTCLVRESVSYSSERVSLVESFYLDFVLQPGSNPTLLECPQYNSWKALISHVSRMEQWWISSHFSRFVIPCFYSLVSVHLVALKYCYFV